MAQALPGADICMEMGWKESHMHTEVQGVTKPMLSFCLGHQINAHRFIISEADQKGAISSRNCCYLKKIPPSNQQARCRKPFCWIHMISWHFCFSA